MIGFFRDLLGRSSSLREQFSSPNSVADQMFRYSDTRPRSDGVASIAATAIKDVRDAYPDEPINLFGHSYGGAAVIDLTNELDGLGITVENVVTLDPVRERTNRPTSVPANTNWVNIFVPEASRMPQGLTPWLNPDTIARIGGPMGFQNGADANFALDQWAGRLGAEGNVVSAGHTQIVVDQLVIQFLEATFGQ